MEEALIGLFVGAGVAAIFVLSGWAIIHIASRYE